MSRPMPIVYTDKVPGRLYCRVEGTLANVPAAIKSYDLHFGHKPMAAYVKNDGFIYMPITADEGATLITIARVD